MTNKKRFIAGATCPKCKQIDSLRLWQENNIEVVECVECDYSERQGSSEVAHSGHDINKMIGIFKP